MSAQRKLDDAKRDLRQACSELSVGDLATVADYLEDVVSAARELEAGTLEAENQRLRSALEKIAGQALIGELAWLVKMTEDALSVVKEDA